MEARLLFPSHPLKPTAPDPDYESEVIAARDAGFECEFYDLDLLRTGEAAQALSRCANAGVGGQSILHRGWMMSDELYKQLCVQLSQKGYIPYVTPDQFSEAHYLPNAYSKISAITPRSEWIFGTDANEAWLTYQRFTDKAAIVKDFVKSAKHRWTDACFIPPNTSRKRFDEIIWAFLEARGPHFNKGIVFREYHPLTILNHDIRGQPVHEEYRLFFLNNNLLAATPALTGEGPLAEPHKWEDVAGRFSNPFITMDIAHKEDNSWIIIEVGDGGVSGLPYSIDSKQFYIALKKAVN